MVNDLTSGLTTSTIALVPDGGFPLTLFALGYTASWADWFSGFFDGEGTLSITSNDQGEFSPHVGVGLGMAMADAEVVEEIQHVLGIGTVCYCYKYVKTLDKRFGAVEWRVRRKRQLAEVIVPLFDAHPLRTKKRNEYPIWRQAVILCNETTTWTANRINQMRGLHADLLALRQVNAGKSMCEIPPSTESPAPKA